MTSQKAAISRRVSVTRYRDLGYGRGKRSSPRRRNRDGACFAAVLGPGHRRLFIAAPKTVTGRNNLFKSKLGNDSRPQNRASQIQPITSGSLGSATMHMNATARSCQKCRPLRHFIVTLVATLWKRGNPMVRHLQFYCDESYRSKQPIRHP